jgi:hypothetical protein
MGADESDALRAGWKESSAVIRKGCSGVELVGPLAAERACDVRGHDAPTLIAGLGEVLLGHEGDVAVVDPVA